MKKIILSLFIIFNVLNASAQYSKLVIQFSDKASNTYNLSNPWQYLSARSLARRTKFKIGIDSTDLPITQRYIDSVRLAGSVVILSKSKWLNQVLIQTTDNNALNKIRSFPFVKTVAGIGFRVGQTAPVDKFMERITPLDPATFNPNRVTADYFSYGSSFGQVHIHEGEFLHNKGFRGENMQITVLDAGFLQYKSVTAFDSIRMNNQILGERDFVTFDNSVNEDDSHGMYCLSTMAANWPGKMVGTAPKANYWLVRTENASSEYPIEEFNWVAGAEFADSTGSDMISSSLGYYDFDDPSFNYSYNNFYKNSTTVTRGATLAAKKGLIVMNSAGNEGDKSWKYLSFPADADSVCAVGAVNVQGEIAPFSSYGYPGKIKPNIVSVGWGTVIAGYNNQPSAGNGTSFSNPNVAGLIACLWQAFPTLSNMKILDAVYKSSNKYVTPTDRLGFGIPNFRTAYLTLKKEENISLYGSNWLLATPDPFTNNIDVRLIGQVNGSVKLELFNSTNQLIATKNLVTEIEEIYNSSFVNLDSFPGGIYNIKYTDSLKSHSIALHKTIVPTENWLVAAPNPFKNTLIVSIKAPETGRAALRLIDARGRKVDEVLITVTQGQLQTVNFTNMPKLQRGAYVLQYIGTSEKRSIKLLKM